jgi:tripartite-type tricarboxylate transporter receptor subunit TctC
VIVGMPTGGSIDGYARLLQRHLPRHLAGSPSLVVKNKPGAGSLLAVQAIANSAAGEGPMMATFSSALIPGALPDPERFKVDFRKLRFIGNIGEDYRVCYFRSATGIHNMQDLAARDQVVIGASAPGSSGVVNVAVLEDLFKIKVKEVRGYPGSADKRLALERGEIDGDCGGIDLIPEEWLAQKKVTVAVRFLAHLPEGVDPSIQFAGDLLTSPADRQVYDLAITPTRLVGTFVVSDAVPKDKLQELRRGFDAMMTDGAFLEDAKKARLPILAIGGAALDQEVASLYATAPALLQRTKALLDR